MTPCTLFDTASTAEAFTALAMAQIIHGGAGFPHPNAAAEPSDKRYNEDDLITFQTPVSTLLPEDFVLPTREPVSHTQTACTLLHST